MSSEVKKVRHDGGEQYLQVNLDNFVSDLKNGIFYSN